MIFVDTNYFLRFLLADVEEQHQVAKELIHRGAIGEVELCTSSLVVFEIFWVFTSFYQKTKQEVVEILENILSLTFIGLDDRNIFEQALRIYKTTTLDFEDCYNIAWSKQQKTSQFMTFDKKIQKYLKKM